jgi:hypothetical protein
MGECSEEKGDSVDEGTIQNESTKVKSPKKRKADDDVFEGDGEDEEI